MKLRSFRKLFVLLVGPIMFVARSGADDSDPPTPAPASQPNQWHFSGGGFGGSGGGGGGFGAGVRGGDFGAIGGGGGGGGGVAVFSGPNAQTGQFNLFRLTDTAYIISTEAIDAATEARWREDLRIMDKLLRNTVLGVAGESAPRAMGIAVTGYTERPPMYIEGCGAVFTGSVNLPLASASNEPPKKDDQPTSVPSAWEKAKSELDTGAHGGTVTLMFNGASAKFDQDKLDKLIDDVVKALPEASHIHDLKPDESVIVTLTGADDSGIPKRLTFKTKKSDIDDAAAGKITPEEFKQRVAHRIG